MYLQPLIATLFAVLMGSDTLTEIRVVAATLIFLGVYLATRKKPKNQIGKL
jgi:drug/metabolite transporter (DMT)-like permease